MIADWDNGDKDDAGDGSSADEERGVVISFMVWIDVMVLILSTAFEIGSELCVISIN